MTRRSDHAGLVEVHETLERFAREADERVDVHTEDGFPAYASMARHRAAVLRQAWVDYRDGPPVEAPTARAEAKR